MVPPFNVPIYQSASLLPQPGNNCYLHTANGDLTESGWSGTERLDPPALLFHGDGQCGACASSICKNISNIFMYIISTGEVILKATFRICKVYQIRLEVGWDYIILTVFD